MNDNILASYDNGNYHCVITYNGTKIRYAIDAIPEYPESMDVKVTNKCDANCPYCHEDSCQNGQNFDINFAVKLFQDLPSGVELALGGGNPLEVAQDIVYLNRKTHCLVNMTLNARHLKNYDCYHPSINALGISYDKNYRNDIQEFSKTHSYRWKQAVIHCIAGINTLEDIEDAMSLCPRVLILGYKTVKRGFNFKESHPEVDKNIIALRDKISDIMYGFGQFKKYNNPEKVIAFDNLAIKQLGCQRFFDEHHWEKVFMGKEGEFSMYLDLVDRKYAVSSTSQEKYDINDLSVKQMFAHIRQISGFKPFQGG